MAVYQPDSEGWDALANGEQVKEHMLVVGKTWAEDLRAEAPRDTGRYAEHITVHLDTVRVARHRRPAAVITADTPYAAILEVGTHGMTDPPRPLTKLLDRIDAADPRHGWG
jgi:hypothetical protein